MHLPCIEIEIGDGLPLPHSSYIHSEDCSVIMTMSVINDEKYVCFSIRLPNGEYSNYGVIGRFISQEIVDSLVLYTFDIIERVGVQNFFMEDNTQYVEYAKIEYIAEEESVEDVFYDLEQLYTPQLDKFEIGLSKRYLQLSHPMNKLFAVGSAILRLDADRLMLLEANSLLEALPIVMKNLKLFLDSRMSIDEQTVQVCRVEPDDDTIDAEPVLEVPAKPTIVERIYALNLPEHVKGSVYREVDKYLRATKDTTEKSLVCDYLHWIADLPWNKYGARDFKLETLESQFDQSHYGLTDAKQHIIEYFCLERIINKTLGSVLCFYGPPGTGKSSIVKEIAQISNRPLIRIALGGMSDEADLRGHRRTYSAARVGRIIAGIKDAGVSDPVILLDECDKLGRGHGDPAAALLEILDPEQNTHFVDRYLEVPYDLSKCLFICTVNDRRLLSEPLQDRMEFVEFKAYTQAERYLITKKYILPKILNQYCIKDYPIVIEESLIENASRIASVRQIEKHLRKLLRQAAVNIYLRGHSNVILDASFINLRSLHSIGF